MVYTISLKVIPELIEVYKYGIGQSIEVGCVLGPNWMLDWFEVGIIHKINGELMHK